MIFWIFVILTVVCIGVIVATNKISNKYDYYERKKEHKTRRFCSPQ